MVTWTNESDAQLFLAILNIHDVKVNHDRVAEELSAALKETVTKSAIMNSINKLKVRAASGGCVSEDGKAGSNSGKNKRGKGQKGKKRKVVEDDVDDEEPLKVEELGPRGAYGDALMIKREEEVREGEERMGGLKVKKEPVCKMEEGLFTPFGI